MIQFEYDGIMKRYDAKVPQVIAGEHSMLTIAHISEDNRIKLLREMKIELVRNLLLHWDEYEYQMTRELQDMLDEPKNDTLTWLEERLQIPGRGERTDAWKDISLNPQTGNGVTIHQTKYLKFSTRTYHVLWAAGINTLGELVEKSERDMFRIKNCGRKTLTELQEKLYEIGLNFKQTDKIERGQYGI
tara:strand:- start:710 stop:1273 length:564 start_codon:yes stop_codon:yes gene_type:complete